MPDKPKRPRGRPVTKPLPPRIDAAPEEIAEVVLKMPPKDDWRYLRKQESEMKRDDAV